jgi:hypothetical protein
MLEDPSPVRFLRLGPHQEVSPGRFPVAKAMGTSYLPDIKKTSKRKRVAGVSG